MESRIQSYLRIAASQQRDTEQIGPFLATFSRSNQNEAYDAPLPNSRAIADLQSSLEAGGIAILARTVATGEPVGAGVCSIPSNQTTEIAGIGVRSAFRRRGVAGALTTRLVQEAFAAGVSVPFLMAAHKAEKRIYTRTGFAIVGEMLHISRSRS